MTSIPPDITRLRLRSIAIAALVATAVCRPLPAQVAPTAPSQPAPADETITLSPFIISTERETGWSANDTLSATRTKQALKDVPVNIDAITADFMEDLGLFSADEVANYVANAWAPQRSKTTTRVARSRFAASAARPPRATTSVGTSRPTPTTSSGSISARAPTR